MLQDELRGVWLVLAVVDVHLELVRLPRRSETIKRADDRVDGWSLSRTRANREQSINKPH